jgi:DNA segregation ATPase FtsK/SpoIIIE, S-DNA-T family
VVLNRSILVFLVPAFVIFVCMARKRSKDSQKSGGADQMQQEKEEQVSVKELVRDERTHKITGTVSMLLALLLFLSFTSYLFTWKEDQDKVLLGASRFLFAEELQVGNLLGRIGAWLAHIFFYESFGVASYLVCSFFFILGINLLFGKKIFSVARNLKYVLVGLLVLPVFFSFFLEQYGFPWGGVMGDFSSRWLKGFMGSTGTAILLIVAVISYLIWRFNPVFQLPAKKEKPFMPPLEEQVLPMQEEAAVTETTNPAKEPEVKNQLKNNGAAVVFPVQPQAQENNPLFDFTLTEREELKQPAEVNEIDLPVEPAPVILPEPVVFPSATELPVTELPQRKKQLLPEDNLELEIKNILDAAAEETAEKPVTENLPPYDPFLDLKDYKFPSLNLLENHGSEKIVQDPHELENYKNQIINT